MAQWEFTISATPAFWTQVNCQKTYKLYKLIQAIQLLSNTQPLADYFIADLHLREINEQNKLGSKGFVTQAFAELIKFFYFLYFY